jgi:hypothetical protein
MNEKTIIKSEKSQTGMQITIAIGAIGLIADLILCIGEGDGLFSTATAVFSLFTLIPCVIIALLFYWNGKAQLTVTDKRVYGTAAFGKRVDLPLDMVSAVGTSTLQGVAVTTSSGAIKFNFIKNRNEIHNEISKLLLDRQDKPAAATTIKQEIPQSNADELKKYKDLFDSGVITQAEFNEKKKHLLGL